MFRKRYRRRTTLNLKFEGAVTIANLCFSSETANDNDYVFEPTMQGEQAPVQQVPTSVRPEKKGANCP